MNILEKEIVIMSGRYFQKNINSRIIKELEGQGINDTRTIYVDEKTNHYTCIAMPGVEPKPSDHTIKGIYIDDYPKDLLNQGRKINKYKYYTEVYGSAENIKYKKALQFQEEIKMYECSNSNCWCGTYYKTKDCADNCLEYLKKKQVCTDCGVAHVTQ